MPDKLTKNDKHVWVYKMNDYLKTEWVLKNLHNLFMVLMALCDKKYKTRLKHSLNLDKKLDSMAILKENKK